MVLLTFLARRLAYIESYNTLKEHGSDIDLFGLPIRVAAIDDLILMKRAANRPKDQNHILELMALKKLTEPTG